MNKKMNILKNSLLIFLVLAAFIQYYIIDLNKSRIDMIMPTVSTRAVQMDLVLLESEINYQMLNEWKAPGQIALRIQNIMDGITITTEMGSTLNRISTSERMALNEFYYHLYSFIENKDIHNVLFSREEKGNLEKLKDQLRASGWGIGIGYPSDWDDFMRKVNHFLDSASKPEG